MEFSKLYRIMEADVNPAMGAKPSNDSGLTLAPYGASNTGSVKPRAGGKMPSPVGGEMAGNLNLQKLVSYLPSAEPVTFKKSAGIVMSGGEAKLTNIQLMNLGKAFVDLIKSDLTRTVQIMNLLKRVSFENTPEPKL